MRKPKKWGEIVKDGPFYPDFPYDGSNVDKSTNNKIRDSILFSLEPDLTEAIEHPMQDVVNAGD